MNETVTCAKGVRFNQLSYRCIEFQVLREKPKHN
jgi:hypothetical protein